MEASACSMACDHLQRLISIHGLVLRVSQATQGSISQPHHVAFASACSRDDPFDHDFVNHIRLSCIPQFFARSIEGPANGTNCRIIENTDGKEPKDKQ
jgi:hypothetical protein